MFFVSFSDPRTNEWSLIDSPFTVLLIIGVYLYFVFKLGHKLMENRKPYNLNTIMILYNVVQVLLSTYIVVEVGLLTELSIKLPNKID